jgi:tryptophan 2,3-dioxygenase
MGITLPCGHEAVTTDQAHYCSYLRLHELLQLQPTGDQTRHPDEHLFVSTHQAFEIWFKQLLFDMQRLIAALDRDNTGLATWLTRRITRITALFTPMIQILDTMAPSDFFTFRPYLSPASGTESQQFRAIEILAGLRDPAYRHFLETPIETDPNGNQTCLWTDWLRTLWESRSLHDAVMDLFRRRGVTPADIYTSAPLPNPNADLFLLAEELLDFDETFALWRTAHARVAERAIGPDIPGTSHTTGVRYLDYTAARSRFFPELWHARTTLWERMGDAPHEPATRRG